MKKKYSSKKVSKKDLTPKLIGVSPVFLGFSLFHEGIAHHGGDRHPLAYEEREKNNANK